MELGGGPHLAGWEFSTRSWKLVRARSAGSEAGPLEPTDNVKRRRTKCLTNHWVLCQFVMDDVVTGHFDPLQRRFFQYLYAYHLLYYLEK